MKGRTDMTTFDTGFKDLDDYLEWMLLRGRKPTSVKNYSIQCRALLRILKEGGRHYTADTIDDEDLLWLNGQLGHLSEQTRKSYIRLVAQLVLHFTGIDQGKRMGVLFNDDTGRCVHFITMEDFVTLYRAGEPVDRIVLILGAFMGLRRAEIAAIREDDINGSVMTVRGKGHGPQGKVAYVDIPDRVMTEIESFRKWKQEYRFGCEGEYLVESGKRHRRLSRMDPNSIGRRMCRLKEITGIEFSSHSLRRLYATTLYYDSQVDLITIKNLMRHAKYETTVSRYIAPMKKKEKEAIVKVSAVFEKALGEL